MIALKNLFGGAYGGKSVFVTGHTGFKGAWLSEWLLELGAEVTGFSLLPPTNPSLFEQIGLGSRLNHIEGDIRDRQALTEAVRRAQPDFIFHLAAQPIVRESYRTPVETYETNVLGTIHLLEAARALKKPCAVVCATTDKCYENREWIYSYREEDPLGGYDPYSSSKAAAEIAIAAWRRSFFQDHSVKLASARAGNVIGGGDWAADRIVPDCIRALQKNQPIVVRNKTATRPWQHVLEPLSGYLWLAACLSGVVSPLPACASALESAFNFGPDHDAHRTVAQLVEEVLKHWPGCWEDKSESDAPHEASLLQLSIDKARALLRWTPVWNFATSVERTTRWYREAAGNSSRTMGRDLTASHISDFAAQARNSCMNWAAV